MPVIYAQPAQRESAPVEPARQASALRAASLGQAVSICVTAILRGDDTTRKAMLAALNKDPRQSCEIVRDRLARASNGAETGALEEILRGLP